MRVVAPSPLGTSPWPLWILGAVLLSTLMWVATTKVDRTGITVEDLPAVQWERQLRFEDRPNGDIAVLDAGTQKEVARFQGEQGFLRGSLRALARERKLSGLGSQAPFHLLGHVDGRLTLLDRATGQRISLESFGPTNSAVFSQLQWAKPVR
ncbi:MAG: photosynthetic complex assembly protein PuhC [Comamonadaceae bacterium]|nr:photosynthetic complex assembly protein PuhC [Comamonadaceae bacterium]